MFYKRKFKKKTKQCDYQFIIRLFFEKSKCHKFQMYFQDNYSYLTTFYDFKNQ